MYPITYHVDGHVGDFQSIVSHLKAVQPRVVFVLNEFKRLEQLLEAGIGEIGIFRTWHPEDGRYWKKYISDNQIRDHLYSLYLSTHTSPYFNRIYFTHYLNEPDADTLQERKALVDYLVRKCRIALDIGMKLAVDGIAVGKTIKREDVENGVWDSLIEIIHENRDMLMFTFHEYGTHFAASFFNDYPMNMKNPASVHPSKWMTPSVDTNHYLHPESYEFLRGTWVTNNRAEELFGESIPAFVAEFGCDNMPHLPSDFYNWIKQSHPCMGVDVHRGFRGWLCYFDWLVEEWKRLGLPSYDNGLHFYHEMVQWMVDKYPPNILGVCLFAWRGNDWVSFNYADPDVKEFRDRLENHASTYEHTEQDEDDNSDLMDNLIEAKVRVITTRNLRVRAKPGGVHKGWLSSSGYVDTIMSEGVTAPKSINNSGKKYEWRYIKSVEGNSIDGWVADEFIEVKSEDDSVTPDDDIVEIDLPIPHWTGRMTRSSAENMRRLLNAIIRQFDEALE